MDASYIPIAEARGFYDALDKENPAPSALATGNSSLTWNDLLLCAEQEHGCPLHHNRSLLALRHPRYAPTPVQYRIQSLEKKAAVLS